MGIYKNDSVWIETVEDFNSADYVYAEVTGDCTIKDAPFSNDPSDCKLQAFCTGNIRIKDPEKYSERERDLINKYIEVNKDKIIADINFNVELRKKYEY